MGILGATLILAHSPPENCLGINGRTPRQQGSTDKCSLCRSTLLTGLGGWAALSIGAPELGANHVLNLPRSRMLPFGLWLFLLSLGPLYWDPQAPHLWQMSPRSLGLTSLQEGKDLVSR